MHTITYWFGKQASGQAGVQAKVQVGDQPSDQVQHLVNTIRENVLIMVDIQVRLKIKSRSFVQMKLFDTEGTIPSVTLAISSTPCKCLGCCKL